MSEYETIKKGYPEPHERPVVKGDLIVELGGSFAGTTIRDITLDGIKLETNYQGKTTGKYEARIMGTTDTLQKIDGTGEWKGRAIQGTTSGDFIVYTGKGQGKATSPDTMSWEGEVEFMTVSPKYSWLNGKKGWLEGSGNVVTNEWHAKIYELR